MGHQSIRLYEPKPQETFKTSDIVTCYSISKDGQVGVFVFNNTDETMVIDQTKSFFVDCDRTSRMFYDPTVNMTTVTDLSSSTTGGSVNLGAIGSAVGIGGTIGSILNGINVGVDSTNGQSVANSSYRVDQEQVTIAPKGAVQLKSFYIKGVGASALKNSYTSASFNVDNIDASPLRFSIVLSYSIVLLSAKNFDLLKN